MTAKTWKDALLALAGRLYCHRVLYAGLSLCHGSASLASGETLHYAVMALLYLLLAMKG